MHVRLLKLMRYKTVLGIIIALIVLTAMINNIIIANVYANTTNTDTRSTIVASKKKKILYKYKAIVSKTISQVQIEYPKNAWFIDNYTIYLLHYDPGINQVTVYKYDINTKTLSRYKVIDNIQLSSDPSEMFYYHGHLFIEADKVYIDGVNYTASGGHVEVTPRFTYIIYTTGIRRVSSNAIHVDNPIIHVVVLDTGTLERIGAITITPPPPNGSTYDLNQYRENGTRLFTDITQLGRLVVTFEYYLRFTGYESALPYDLKVEAYTYIINKTTYYEINKYDGKPVERFNEYKTAEGEIVNLTVVAYSTNWEVQRQLIVSTEHGVYILGHYGEVHPYVGPTTRRPLKILFDTPCSVKLPILKDEGANGGYEYILSIYKADKDPQLDYADRIAYFAAYASSDYPLEFLGGMAIHGSSPTVVTVSIVMNGYVYFDTASRYSSYGGICSGNGYACLVFDSGNGETIIYNRVITSVPREEILPVAKARINGTMVYARDGVVELGGNGTSIVLPANGSSTIYVSGAELEVTRVVSREGATNIVLDSHVRDGDAAYMADRKLILVGGGGGDNRLDLKAGGRDADVMWVHHHTWSLGKWTNPDPFRDDVYHAVAFQVPISPVPASTDIYGTAKLGIETNVTFTDNPVNLGPVVTPVMGSVVAYGVSSYAAGGALAGVGGATALTIASFAAAVVFTGWASMEIVWGSMNYRISWHELYGYVAELQGPNGTVYVADIFLPREELPHADWWMELARRSLEGVGIGGRVIVHVESLSTVVTWEDYTRALANGAFNRYSSSELLVNALRSSGLDADRYTVTGIYVVHVVDTHAEPTPGVQIFKNGIYAVGETRYHLNAIRFYAFTKDSEYTRPEDIAKALPYVLFNGVRANATIKDGRVVYRAELENPSPVLNVYTPYMNDIVVGSLYVNASMEDVMDPIYGGVGYRADIYYGIKDLNMRIRSFEFIDVPGRARYVERIFHYRYGDFDNFVPGEYLREIANESEASDRCILTKYVLDNTRGILFIDPTNGGLFEYGKNITIIYWLDNPPDAAIHLYFNGTSRTSTVPRHLTVIINSTVPQTVRYSLKIGIYYFQGLEKHAVSEDEKAYVMNVSNIGYRTFNIQEYIYRALRLQREYNNTRTYFIEIEGRIVSAEHDAVKANDVDRIQYYPPSSYLVNLGRNYTLAIYVYNASSGMPVENATVAIYGNMSFIGRTCRAGWLNITDVPSGLYTIQVSAQGFLSYETSLMLTENTTLSVPLIPSSGGGGGNGTPVRPPYNDTYTPPVRINHTTYWWLSVQVVTRDGFPVQGAKVNITDLSSNATIFRGATDTTGFVYLLVRNGTPVRVDVYEARNDSVLNESRTLTVDNHYYLVFKAPWSSRYFEPEVGFVYAEIHIHSGYSYVPDGGNVSHLITYGVWTNTPQRVTINVTVYDNVTGSIIDSFTESHDLVEGLNEFFTWFNVSSPRNMSVYAVLRIVGYVNDTNPGNNEIRTGQVNLHPLIDNSVAVFIYNLKTQVEGFLLPGDLVVAEVYVKPGAPNVTIPLKVYTTAYIPFNHTTVRMTLIGRDVAFNGSNMTVFNFTIMVPWTQALNVTANITSPMDEHRINDVHTATVDVAPSTRLERLDADKTVTQEKGTIGLDLYLLSNAEPGRDIWVNVVPDEGSIKTYTVPLARHIHIEYETSENHWLIPGIIKRPAETRRLEVYINAPDTYNGDNSKTVDVTTMSAGVTAAAILVGLIAVIVVMLMILHGLSKIRRHEAAYLAYSSKYIE